MEEAGYKMAVVDGHGNLRYSKMLDQLHRFHDVYSYSSPT